MGHAKVETTKNIYGHLFAADRAAVLEAMNQAVSGLYAYEEDPGESGEETAALPCGPTDCRAAGLVAVGVDPL